MTGHHVLMAGIFALAGVMHFVAPNLFIAIMPRWLPAWLPSARTLVYVSGVVEIFGAIGLLMPSTRVWAAWTLIALLIAVFPANVQMLVDARARESADWWIAALWIRLPLQLLLIWWVWRAGAAAK